LAAKVAARLRGRFQHREKPEADRENSSLLTIQKIEKILYMAIYDQIGKGYNSTRQADPYIADRLCDLLQPHEGGIYLEIGCGTGNYLAALSAKGYSFYGVDPSETMLETARNTYPAERFILATADSMPLPDANFDGAIAILTLHHWANLEDGLAGVARVLKPGANWAIFSFAPEQMKGYWLHHYFPEMIERCMSLIPSLYEMKAMLIHAGFGHIGTEKYFIRPEHIDHFLYSHKSRPEKYLEAGVRNNASAFRLQCTEDELEDGLQRLEADIRSGEIATVMASYENDLGDYLFIKAERL
jgi:ubiquinone/menaquinone biosynthesis C-methylase UbiE